MPFKRAPSEPIESGLKLNEFLGAIFYVGKAEVAPVAAQYLVHRGERGHVGIARFVEAKREVRKLMTLGVEFAESRRQSFPHLRLRFIRLLKGHEPIDNGEPSVEADDCPEQGVSLEAFNTGDFHEEVLEPDFHHRPGGQSTPHILK